MTGHGARDHATWSASATARNWNCAGALALVTRLTTPERSSEAADWGTACHQISERCFKTNVDAISFLGDTEKTKEREFEIDEEMCNTSQEYVDYVRGRMKRYRDETGDAAQPWVEVNFSLESLKPPFDAGGTADMVLWFPEWRLLEVVDLKGGRGVVVEAKGNYQARTYALGAVIKLAGLNVREVMTTIVQPRANHKDGRIRSETIHIADLIEWTTDLVAAMKRSAGADAALREIDAVKGSRALWYVANLKAGDHCKFCPIAGHCPALEQRALDAAGVWFDDLDKPQLANAPQTMTPDKLRDTLDLLDMIGEWANSVRAYAHEQAESGVKIPDYQLVQKIGNRRWIGGEENAQSAILALPTMTTENAFTRKLKSPAQIEKVLGSTRKGLIEKLVERPVTGTNLVRENKTSRPAEQAAVNRYFDDVTN